MTTEPTPRPVLQRFLDSFFQEQNIRWMLALGLVTVFGSSLMLVRSGWEQYQPAWRQVVVLLYCATIYFAGAVCRRRLSLPKTAAFLRGLSLLLIPVAFLALNLLRASESVVASGQTVPLLLTSWPWLLGLTTLLAGAAAWRIFTDVFRGPQPVFTLAFLVLAAAGAVVPVLPHSLLPLVAAGLWCVLTAGSVAITREVFHLTERHRAPMWAGYLPLCLLGVEFIAVFSLGIAGHLSQPLTGLGLVLSAIPVLYAAETLLKVFRQRTGGLVQRLPVAVAAPGLVGLLLCAGGLVLSAGGFPPSGVVVPAALITAALLLRAASLTGREALVWIGLVCLSAAYQFSPVLFRETARQALATSAEMVRETRMPLAFYGLTWLPLLAGLAGMVPFLRRRGQAVFVRPIELFSLVLTGSLFLVAFGHGKALFPVSLALGVLSVVQTVVFRRAGWLRFSLAAGAVSCSALPLFLRTVCGWELPVALPVLLVALYSAGLTGLAGLTGRTLKYSQLRERLINGSRIIALIAAMAWAACLTLTLLPEGTTTALMNPAAWELATITAVLLSVLLWHTVCWPVAGLSEIALAFACGGPALAAAAAGVPGSLALSGFTVATALCWLAGRMCLSGRLKVMPRDLGEAALRTAGAMFCGLTALWVVPAMFCLAAGLNVSLHLPEMNLWQLWLTGGLCLAWCFDVARVQALPGFTYLGILLAVLLTAGGTVSLLGMEQGWYWMPQVLACLPAVALVPVIRLHHRISRLAEATELDVLDHGILLPLDRLRAVQLPLQGSMLLLAVGLASGSLAVWTLPHRLAGLTILLTAVAARLMFRDRGRAHLLEAWLAVQACGMLLSLLAGWLLPGAETVFVLASPQTWFTGLPLAAAAAGLMLPVYWLACRREGEETDTAEATAALLHSLLGALWLVCLGGLFGGIIARFGAGTWSDLLYASITLAILCGRELLAAHRSGQEQRVASAGILAGVCSVALWMLKGTAVPLWVPALALVLLSLLLDTISRRLQREEPVSVLARPFSRAALALPVVSLLMLLWWPLMLVGYSLTGAAGGLAEAGSPFVNPASVTALLTGCLFLLYGLRDRRTWCVAAALLALNGVFAESCLRLGWRDPQVFCMPLGASVLLLVELLRKELPANWRTPLRMAGGLTILLSPLPGVFDGSWLPLFSLMAASIVVTLLAIGLRVRSMTWLGTAFLLADLVGMVLRGSVDHPGLLWVAGLVTGGCVMALAAFCENHRELLASRLRQLAAELETWQ